MSAPQRVEIVRPRRDVATRVATGIGTWTEWFVSAFALMLLIPIFASWHPGYWQTVALVAALRVAWHPPQLLDLWSSATPKKRGVA